MVASCAGISAAPAFAAETTNYTYDALGRLIDTKVTAGQRAGSEASYTLDPAGNRTNVTSTSKKTIVIVVPLNGLTVIPIVTHD